jgi:hypothetical protein
MIDSQRHLLISLIFLSGALASAEPVPGVEPFLDRHCVECHDDDVAKGDLDLLSLKPKPGDAANFAIWERCRTQLNRSRSQGSDFWGMPLALN